MAASPSPARLDPPAPDLGRRAQRVAGGDPGDFGPGRAVPVRRRRPERLPPARVLCQRSAAPLAPNRGPLPRALGDADGLTLPAAARSSWTRRAASCSCTTSPAVTRSRTAPSGFATPAHGRLRDGLKVRDAARAGPHGSPRPPTPTPTPSPRADPAVAGVLVANKVDLRDTGREAVSAEEGKRFAESLGLEYVETSAVRAAARSRRGLPPPHTPTRGAAAARRHRGQGPLSGAGRGLPPGLRGPHEGGAEHSVGVVPSYDAAGRGVEGPASTRCPAARVTSAARLRGSLPPRRVGPQAQQRSYGGQDRRRADARRWGGQARAGGHQFYRETAPATRCCVSWRAGPRKRSPQAPAGADTHSRKKGGLTD